MTAPVVTTSNLVMGPGWLYKGAFGATEPTDASVNLPLAATGFTNVGGTSDGAELEIAKTYTDLAVDQLVDIPGARVTHRATTIKTNLAELTLDNLAFALNEVASVTATAPFSTFEPNADISSTQPVYSAIILDGFGPGGFRRRVIMRKVLNVANVTFAYKKDGQSFYTVSFRTHYVSASIRPFKIIDQNTT